MSNPIDLEFADHLCDFLNQAQRGMAAYNAAAFPERTPQFFALELNGEAGEIANKEKKIWKGRNLPLQDLEEEAADVLIALINYANSRQIELGKAFQHKLNTIEQRRLADIKSGKTV